jgi:hypothetical protein
MQLSKQNSTASKVLLLLVLSTVLFSFSSNFGGDVFKIYVNKKLWIEQAVYKNEPAKTIPLEQNLSNEEIEVYYSHCGATGKSRSIRITDGQNKLLKEWHYADVTTANKGMSLKVKDILSLQNKANQLQLFYSSKELPAGKLLVAMSIGSVSKARP